MNSSLTINSLKLSDADFERIVRANPEANFEQTAAGDLVVVPPTGGTSGERSLYYLSQELFIIRRSLTQMRNSRNICASPI
jgi:Uma2 family endonuclease